MSPLYAQAEEQKRSALPDVSKRTLEEWVTRIKERYTAEQWIALEGEERQKLDIDGKRITAIGSMFGIARPQDTILSYLLLGEKIYGADNEVIKSALAIAKMEEEKRSALPDVSKRTLEEWVPRIKEEYTAEKWVALSTQPRKIDIDGKRIAAIASIFGIKGRVDSALNQLLLGEKIYGVDDQLIQAALAKIREKKG